MTKPICVKCGLFFRPKKNGQMWEEGKPSNDETPVRHTEPDGTEWTSYKIWQGDLWECRDCGVQVIVGTGAKPWFEHYQEEYAAAREACEHSLIFVHDC